MFACVETPADQNVKEAELCLICYRYEEVEVKYCAMFILKVSLVPENGCLRTFYQQGNDDNLGPG